MARQLRLCSWVLAINCTAFGQILERPVVDLGYAKYQGIYDASTKVNVWHSIPYALPPTGKLRWHAPSAIDKINITSSAVLDASKLGPACIQGCPVWETKCVAEVQKLRQSEDCLRLDVLSPISAPKPGPNSTLLPVIVKIHGGGYVKGNSEYAGGYSLIKHSQGALVYVSIQYRLGVYGFLASRELERDGVANTGLLDQRLALIWVKRYAEKFGGDPERITIVGGSAGGGSVTAQMMLYGAVDPPPFKAAIAEYPWWQSFKDQKTLAAQYEHLLLASKCGDLTCLRGLSESDLATASQETYVMGYATKPKPLYGYGDYYFGPVVDGKSIWGLPSKQFEKGNIANVPLLVSRNRYEGYDFSNMSHTNKEELTADLQELFPNATQPFLGQLYKLYPQSDYNSTFYQRVAMFGDYIINCPTRTTLQAVNKKNSATYKMVFNAGHQLHGATYDLLYNSAYDYRIGSNTTLSRFMKDWWISFAIHSNPNRQSDLNTPSSGKPYWPLYGLAGDTLIVNVTSIGVTQDSEISDKCDFWHDQSDIVRNRLQLEIAPDY